MVWLISLPIWVLLWRLFIPENPDKKTKDRAYMIVCSLALIFVLGLRSRYTGSTDTYFYSLVFNGANNYSSLHAYLTETGVFDEFFLFSEAGFHTYTWLSARILPEAQWFILLTSAIIVILTAIFISENSDDHMVSWITFICLGSMTFAMNGMRQALAMSICLLSYRYARENKFLSFLLIVLIATLFHKSALVFLIVYLMRNMRLNGRSFAFLATCVSLLLIFADRLAFLYDSLTGEDYEFGDTFESGGAVVVAIYIIAIVGMLIFSKKLKEPEGFFPFVLILIGCSFYIGRFLSTQIYERISYYFAYFLMLGFPLMLKDMKEENRFFIRAAFVVLSVALFAYRIGKGAFSDFAMCW